jgi:hypothetical protein
MSTPIIHTRFTFDILKEQRSGLEFLLDYYKPYTRAYGAILVALTDTFDHSKQFAQSDNVKPNQDKQIPKVHSTTFYVCNEPGCNALCPPEMFKCGKHRDPNDIPLKTDEPVEIFYINPKYPRK